MVSGADLGLRDVRNLVTVDSSVIRNAASLTIPLLQSHARRGISADKNFAIARSHFSYTALKGILREIFKKNELNW